MTQSLGKALKLLEIISTKPNGVGLSEISRLAKMPKGTVHRLLQSLVENGYLEQMEDSRYIMGVKVVVLAQNITDNRPIIRLARPFMEEIAQATNETINLATLGAGRVVYLDEILTRQPVGTISKLGTTAPVHCTALGKAMLAFADEAKRQSILEGYNFKQYTENTFTSPEKFREELARIRERGYAIDNIEYEPEKRCVGAPIIDGVKRVVGALSISGPFFRVTEEKAHEYGRLLCATTRRISDKLTLSY